MAAKKTLNVSAPLVVAMTKNGRMVHLYLGDLITEDITQESVDHLKELGFLTEGDAIAEADAEAQSDDSDEAKPAAKKTAAPAK